MWNETQDSIDATPKRSIVWSALVWILAGTWVLVMIAMTISDRPINHLQWPKPLALSVAGVLICALFCFYRGR